MPVSYFVRHWVAFLYTYVAANRHSTDHETPSFGNSPTSGAENSDGRLFYGALIDDDYLFVAIALSGQNCIGNSVERQKLTLHIIHTLPLFSRRCKSRLLDVPVSRNSACLPVCLFKS